MTAEQLLQELEVLPYHARLLRMIDIGRSAIHDFQIAALLTTLEQGDFYSRFLALYACFGSYNATHILRALADPSRTIRGIAIDLAAQVCNEEQLQEALVIVPRDGRQSLLWKLHNNGYAKLIDIFIEHLANTNDPQFPKLLPHASSTLVRQYIGRIQHTMRLVDWRRLARHHPTIAFELLQAQAVTITTLDLQLLAFANGILPILANKQPDQALLLVETLAHFAPLSRLDLQRLSLQRPEGIVDLLLREEDIGKINIDCIAHKLDDRRLLALLDIHSEVRDFFSSWISRMQPERRSTLYALFNQIWQDSDGCISADIIAHLPREQREPEARRHLALPVLETRPEQRLPYAEFLPWDEALSLLAPFLHDPDQRIRSMALKTLTQNVLYERGHLETLLSIIQGHLNEPDPVCGTMLNDLAELPRRIWNLTHLEILEQIVETVINTFDRSSFTIGALSLLLTRLLDCAPEWSATQIASIAQVRGLSFNYGCIENRLSNTDVRYLGPALRPVFVSWAEAKNEAALQEALFLFGERVRVLDELLEALEIAFNHTASFEFGDMVLSIISKYRPARAADLIPTLLQGNPEWINYPAVSTYLHRQRQDLLTPFLSTQKYSTLFPIPPIRSYFRKGHHVINPLTYGFACLTAHQQTLFANNLLAEIHDQTNNHITIMEAIVQLAALPAIPVEHLITLTNDPHPIVRDKALILLSKLDTGQGIAVLLAALHDERAVRAIYALRPFLLATPTQQALNILHSIPLTKVTIAKEVVRLMGDLPGEEAYQALLALDKQELHRDVRAAYLRTLWPYLERDEAWSILEREVQSSDITIALSTVPISTNNSKIKERHAQRRLRRKQQHFPTIQNFSSRPSEHLARKAQQRLMHLFSQLLARPEIMLRMAVLQGCTRLAAADEDQILLSLLLKAMDEDNEDIYKTAAKATFGTYEASDIPLITQAIGRVIPNRNKLQNILEVLQANTSKNKRHLLPLLRSVLDTLATDPITIELRVELAVTLLPWDEVATLLEKAAATGELHPGALNRACETLKKITMGYTATKRSDIKNLAGMEKRLATSPNEYLRRIALAALIAQAELPPNWNKDQRARLQVYRADPSLLVKAPAQFTQLPKRED